MKKVVSLILVVMLIFSVMIIPSFAASDAVISKNTSLSQKFNVYNNLTIKSGVTLTTGMAGNEPQGIEMHGKLTLELGAKIVGQGIILMFSGSSYSGINFYYQVQGQYKQFPDMDTAYRLYKSGDGFVFEFAYSSAVNGWLWKVSLNGGDPFEEPSTPETQQAESYAEALKALGLMKGVGQKPDGTTNYDLNRKLTRTEAVVMMIRILGKEQEALNGTYSHPFTDVPVWADKYVGYAYSTGITKGVSATLFGSSTNASAQMYITFILRAMGYNDSADKGAVDFTYNESPYFARNLGINFDDNQIQNFKRAHAAMASFYALRANCKDGFPLFEKLIDQGVFTRAEYDTVMSPYENH